MHLFRNPSRYSLLATTIPSDPHLSNTCLQCTRIAVCPVTAKFSLSCLRAKARRTSREIRVRIAYTNRPSKHVISRDDQEDVHSSLPAISRNSLVSTNTYLIKLVNNRRDHSTLITSLIRRDPRRTPHHQIRTHNQFIRGRRPKPSSRNRHGFRPLLLTAKGPSMKPPRLSRSRSIRRLNK